MRYDWPLFAKLGLRFSRFRAVGNERVRGHSHATTHLLFLLDGAMCEGAGRSSHELHRGHARMSGPHTKHDIDFGEGGAECLVIHTAWQTPPQASTFLDADAVEAVYTPLRDNLNTITDAPLAALAAMHAVSGIGARRATPDWLIEARRMLLDDDTPTISQIGRTLGVTREHLTRAYCSTFGVPPQVTRRLARAARVARLIARGDAAAEAAIEAGYVDQSHLTRELRALFGVTPRELRRLTHHADTIPAR